MANKGVRAELEPEAIQLYKAGHSLSSIAERLKVSVTSVARWKADSKVPSEDIDGWDKARRQRRGKAQRLETILDQQFSYIESVHPSERTSSMADFLIKLYSLQERQEKMEKTHQVAEEVVKEVKEAGLSDATADDIRSRILGIGA